MLSECRGSLALLGPVYTDKKYGDCDIYTDKKYGDCDIFKRVLVREQY